MLEASLCKTVFSVPPNIIICLSLSNIIATSGVFLKVYSTIMQDNFYASVKRKPLLQRLDVSTQDGERATESWLLALSSKKFRLLKATLLLYLPIALERMF